MEYGSVCSGVEAAGLAWMPLGWKAKFLAEVEPFPCAVLQQRFNATKPLRPLDPEAAETPKERKMRESWKKQTDALPDGGEIPNLGDFTKITKEDYNGKIDLLVGGTPCQAFSLAGLRKGIVDPRGNLALEFVRLAYRTDANWVVWENVPGVFSSGKGQDFASFLSLLCGWEVPVPKEGWGKCGIVTNAPGCFGVAWRVLDAQYTRVAAFPRAIPQRRRRVFIVGYRGGPVGGSSDWQYPAQVLFDGEMRERDTPPCRETRTGTSGPALHGAEASGGDGISVPGMEGVLEGRIMSLATAQIGEIGSVTEDCLQTYTLHNGGHTYVFGKGENFSQALRMREGCSGGGKGPLVSDEKSLTLATGNDQTIMQAQKVIWWDGGDRADTITCTGNNQLMPDKKRLQCVIDMRQIEVIAEEVSPTLIATDYKGGKAVMENGNPMPDTRTGKLVCYENHGNDSRVTECGDVAPTLTGRMGTGGNNQPLCQDIVAFIKNDAGGNQQHYDRDVFPTIRSQVLPAVAVRECFNITACDANGTRADRPDGGLYVTKAEAGKTITAGTPNAETVVVDGAKTAPEYVPSGKGGSYGIICNASLMHPCSREVSQVLAVGHQSGVLENPEPSVGWRATVRRLLPVECERLMGFPDNHTRIRWKGKKEEECPDAPRYKACGNSFCVNVLMWIGERIQAVDEQIRRTRGMNMEAANG